MDYLEKYGWRLLVKITFLLHVFLILLLGSISPLHAVGTNSAGYWIQTYGEATSAGTPQLTQAKEIFQNVLAVADIKSNRYPRLLIVKSRTNPWAMAIPDGTILLSQGAVATCYKDVPPEVGNARLAFILGHELAHQGKDDFWHVAAFTALQKHDGKEQDALVSLLQQTADVRGNEHRDRITRTKELQADSYGLIYMSMAGYDPGYIFDFQGQSFFEQWVEQITGNVAYSDPTHPGPRQRAEFLEAQLQPVSRDLDLFHFSVRLYQAGRIEDALTGFETFRQKYPGREVFSNLGLCHYQLALQALAACGGWSAFPFAPATMIDNSTRAEKLRGDSGDCLDDPVVKHHLSEAIRHLEKAASMDNLHLPSHLNLSSALIMAQQPTRAMAVADEALQSAPGNALAINNKAIALYLFGRANNFSMSGQAITLLQSTVQSNGKNIPWQLYYNLAALQEIKGEHAAADKARKQALRHGPEELYAGILQGDDGGGQQQGPNTLSAAPPPVSPFSLGLVSPAGREQLVGFTAAPFRFAGIRATAYRSNTLLVYEVDGVVEMVETELAKNTDPVEYHNTYGPPRQIYTTPSGQTWCYDEFLLDIANGRAVRIIFLY